MRKPICSFAVAMVRVLLVEDELLLRRIASAMLERLNCQVTLAENGQAALQHVNDSWDLVLMDCQMPVLNGLDATRRWRNFERDHGRARVRIVALTGATSDDERDACLQAGMDDFVSKPLTPDKLQRVLDSVAQGKAETNVPPTLRELRDEYAGYEPLLLELARAFESQLPSLLAQLSQAVDANNAEETFQVAHSIKGKALSLHAHELAAQLEVVERNARQNDLETARATMPALGESGEVAQQELRALMAALEA